jgi:uncharacterized protein YuzB (UPF0349 family)
LVPPPGSPGIQQVIDFARYGKLSHMGHCVTRLFSLIEKWHTMADRRNM